MTHKHSETATSRRTFLRGATGTALMLATGAGIRPSKAATEKINFQLDWIPYGRHAPYYTALEKGFYSSAGLDVSIEQGRGSTMGFGRLVSGQTQFLFQDLGVMIGLREKEHAKVKALACIYQNAPHTVFYIKGRGISKPKDLEGKKIAVSPGDFKHLLFSTFARANNIDETTISWLSVDPNSKNAVLLNHQADAMLTYLFTLPVLQKAAMSGDVVETFPYGDYGANFYSNSLVAMDDFIKQKPDTARRFVQATMQGVKYTIEHPEEAVGFLKKHQPQLDVETALKEIPILRKLTGYGQQKGPLGSMTTELIKKTQDMMVEYLNLQNPAPVSDLFTNEFLT